MFVFLPLRFGIRDVLCAARLRLLLLTSGCSVRRTAYVTDDGHDQPQISLDIDDQLVPMPTPGNGPPTLVPMTTPGNGPLTPSPTPGNGPPTPSPTLGNEPQRTTTGAPTTDTNKTAPALALTSPTPTKQHQHSPSRVRDRYGHQRVRVRD